jgi:hypothetical protein
VDPDAVIVGLVVSTVHVTVRLVEAVLPHASVAVKVRVSERVQPLVVTALSTDEIVGVLQVSFAVALPRAASICAAVGLQPAFNVVPLAVMIGEVVSTVQVTVRLVLALSPHASVAVKVRVCDRAHAVTMILPSQEVTVTALQVSVAVALPNALLMALAEGLQPSDKVLPVAVMVGAVVSWRLIVWTVDAMEPQGLRALHVLLIVLVFPQPVVVTSEYQRTVTVQVDNVCPEFSEPELFEASTKLEVLSPVRWMELPVLLSVRLIAVEVMPAAAPLDGVKPVVPPAKLRNSVTRELGTCTSAKPTRVESGTPEKFALAITPQEVDEIAPLNEIVLITAPVTPL